MSSAATDLGSASRRLVADLITQGGDERIWLDAGTRRNRYGCGNWPESGVAEFSSTTASTISAGAFETACAFLEAFPTTGSVQEGYLEAADAIRKDLARLCGLPARAAANIVLSPSGTDLHLLVANLARGPGLDRLTTVMADPGETGRGVPLAVRGLRFGKASAYGAPGAAGAPLPGAVVGETLAVALRQPDGSPRPPAEVDADFEGACRQAIRASGRVLLVLVDVSKTGLIAPSPACAVDLKQRYGDALTVLVDACQFRLAAESLVDYLAADFLVALTGSKFVSGPAFSGALLLPDASGSRLKSQPLLPALGDYSARGDWPGGFVGRKILPDLPNFGMLCRWRAALHELEAFRALPLLGVRTFLSGFASRITAAIEENTAFEPLETPAPKRPSRSGWDGIATIFPFCVQDSAGALSLQRLQKLHERLQNPPAGGAVRLGQPVTIGWCEDQPFGALRISASARMVVEAVNAPDQGERVIARALDALAIATSEARRV